VGTIVVFTESIVKTNRTRSTPAAGGQPDSRRGDPVPPAVQGDAQLSRSAEEAAQLPAIVAALTKGSAQAKLATRRLSMAMLRDAPDDQLIDACIGLEALLGHKGAEISYRVAVRAAALLSSHPDAPRSPEVIFKATRKVYDRRSELVHGSTSNKNASFELTPGKEPMPTHAVAVWLLQDVLHERLTRPGWTVASLDALVLSGLTQAGASTQNAADVAGTEPDDT
jgi:Apea-like HEPN